MVVWDVGKLNFIERVFMQCVMMVSMNKAGEPAELKPGADLLASTESCSGSWCWRDVATALDVNLGPCSESFSFVTLLTVMGLFSFPKSCIEMLWSIGYSSYETQAVIGNASDPKLSLCISQHY